MFEELISFVQSDIAKILKVIDEILSPCKELMKYLNPKESKVYNKNICEPINKFRDEINFMIKKFIKKLRKMISSYKNNI